MATGPKLVHKQFNSPIGLYSQHNIQETLNKHLQNLDNGTVGINFSDPTTDKPTNLANSAVLRMLEEEERTRRGYPSQKKVVWPPVPETNGYHQPLNQQQSPAYYNAQHSPTTPQNQQPSPHYKAPAQQYQTPSNQYQAPQQRQPPQQHQPQSPQYQTPAQQHSPAFVEGRRQEQTGFSKLIPVGPGVTASPTSAPYRPAPASPIAPASSSPQQNSRWAPVPAPLSPQTYGSQPSYQTQQSPQQQQYSQPQYSSHQQYSQPNEYSSPQYNSQQQYSQPQQYYQEPQKQFEPPATTITLRPQQPIHQKPSPVFTSQPAAASFKGGVNMRGDMKWPPQSVKEAVEAENEARRLLAKGPACRPRKVKKDYSSFFARHALTNNYPGYKAPPGTQHYEDYPGRSSY